MIKRKNRTVIQPTRQSETCRISSPCGSAAISQNCKAECHPIIVFTVEIGRQEWICFSPRVGTINLYSQPGSVSMANHRGSPRNVGPPEGSTPQKGPLA